MQKNVGKTDRIIRIIAAIFIAVFGVIDKDIFGFLSIPLLLTAIFSWCPMYANCGRSTCGTNHKN
jgi:hypothetical protein